MQPRLRSLYRYTMCKLIAKPAARTVGAGSESPLVDSLSGIGRLAQQPPLREALPGERFDAPCRSPPNRWSVLEEPSERIRGKGAFRLPGVAQCGCRCGGRPLSMAMLTYLLKLAPVPASRRRLDC